MTRRIDIEGDICKAFGLPTGRESALRYYVELCDIFGRRDLWINYWANQRGLERVYVNDPDRTALAVWSHRWSGDGDEHVTVEVESVSARDFAGVARRLAREIDGHRDARNLIAVERLLRLRPDLLDDAGGVTCSR
jgi:hypothetical protein